VNLSLRQIKSRISSVRNTGKVTGAMELVALSKLKILQANLFESKSFCSSLLSMVNNILTGRESYSHPLLAQKPEKNIALLVLTSDTGLCGSYNNLVLNKSDKFIADNKEKNLAITCIGRKGGMHFRRTHAPVAKQIIGLSSQNIVDMSKKISGELTKDFMDGKLDAVYAVYTKYESVVDQHVSVEKILGIETPAGKKIEYIFEPRANETLDKLLPIHVAYKFYSVLLNSLICENYLRTVAMKQATTNAKDLLDELVLWRNKVRQYNITKEILEVVSSADALKG